MTRVHRIRFTTLFGVVLLGLTPATQAAPSLWWDHFDSSTDTQVNCVRQAEAIVAGEKSGHVTSDADSVRTWSEKTISVTECIPFGNRLIVAVLVSSEDAQEGTRLFNRLRAGMTQPSINPTESR